MGKGNRNRPTSASGSVTEVRSQAAGTFLWVIMHVLTVPSLATKTPTSPIGGVLNQVFLNFASCGAVGGGRSGAVVRHARLSYHDNTASDFLLRWSFRNS